MATLDSFERLRKRCREDTDTAGESMETGSFDDAASKYTAAITSCKQLIKNIEARGRGKYSSSGGGSSGGGSGGGGSNGTAAAGDAERKHLADLYRARAQAHINNGRYRTAVKDCCDVASKSMKGRADVWHKKGKALTPAGELEAAEHAYPQGLARNFPTYSRACSLGIDIVNDVHAHLQDGRGALQRQENSRAIECADRALELSPNLESAQKLSLDALEKGGRWSEARCRCEVWAHNLSRCNCKDEESEASVAPDAFAKGAGPPRECARAIHPALRPSYCRALCNVGAANELEDALDESSSMVAAGSTFTSTEGGRGPRVASRHEQAGLTTRLKREKDALEAKLEEQAAVLARANEHLKATESEKERLKEDNDEMRATLGSLVALPEASRAALAATDDLDQLLEECCVCQERLLQDVGAVSFGIMSYSCRCTTLRKMHMNCTVSMSSLHCPICSQAIVVIAPSLMVAGCFRSFRVRRSR